MTHDPDSAEQGDVGTRLGRGAVRRRRELGVSQERLAHLAGLNRTYMGDIERGTRNPGIKNVEKISHALGLTVGELFTLYVNEEPPPHS